MRTYTPGYTAVKTALCLMGLLIVGVGVGNLWVPLRLLAVGHKATAEVVAVIVSRPDEKDLVLTTKDDVKEDPSRCSIFHYRVRYTPSAGQPADGMLNIAFQGKPNYNIGDTFAVRYDPAQPGQLFALADHSTWTFGGFLILVGLFLATVQGLYLLHARTPIPIPEDTPAGA